MGVNPHQITRDLEKALCEYTGAPAAVAVTSCTMALLLAVAWHLRSTNKWWLKDGERDNEVSVPKRTYISVPMSIIHAGGRPVFRDEEWRGSYNLHPLPVWDSARWFTSGMWSTFSNPNYPAMVCVSFHASKTLGDTQGGAILLDNPHAVEWLRRARFDGRTEGVAPKDDIFTFAGWHAYLSPDVAARLLWHLSVLPKHNDKLPNDDYPDLSLHEAFQ